MTKRLAVIVAMAMAVVGCGGTETGGSAGCTVSTLADGRTCEACLIDMDNEAPRLLVCVGAETADGVSCEASRNLYIPFPADPCAAVRD